MTKKRLYLKRISDMKKEISKVMISCIIPTYKRSDSLLRAVNSILDQTYENVEVIVVDDNEPNDEYSLIVQQNLGFIEDERLRYLQQEKHINGAAARNFGVNQSKGQYIAFLDDDDEWMPDKLEKQVTILSNLDMSYGAVSSLTTIYRNGEKVRTTPAYTETDLHKKVLEHSVSIFTGTVLFRKECLDETGYFNTKLERHQDLQLFTDFLAHYKMKPMNISLMKSHVDDAGNRPDTSKLVKVKKEFFEEMQDDMAMYSKKEQKNILASHYFEIIFSALKEKNLKYIIIYLLKIGFNFKAYQIVMKRFFDRKKAA